MLRRPLNPKPAKCPHCRERLPKLGDKIHPDCVGPWYAANEAKLREKTAQRIKRMSQEARKQERAQDRATREAMKRLPDLKREAQTAFNAWIRLRDAGQPCISCGAPPPDLSGLHAGRDAGHYRSVGSAPQLRYHADNVHGQCVACNQWGAGKAVEYRTGLIARIGLARVEALECTNEPRKWTHDELRGIRDDYRAKTKALKAKHA